jgi:hypothetical protein
LTLDITKIAAQIGQMTTKIQEGSQERQAHLRAALAQITDDSVNLSLLKRKIATARTPWAVAEIYHEINGRFPAPPCPPEYTVLATDGSNIDVDRHRAAHCYLINIGAVNLHYGLQPAAGLESLPYLYSDESDLVIKNERNARRQQQIEGALLDARRSVEECRHLAQMAAALPDSGPVLAVMDGSLVLFGLESFPDFVKNKILDESFLPSLQQLLDISRRRPLALASYISLPRSTDVVNTLRIALCPQEKVECDLSCSAGQSACDCLSGINDRLLFTEMLLPGQRSSLFINPSDIIKDHYGLHQVYFFYLKLEDEIARVEVPEWVATRPELLDFAHSLVLDQCRRGQGYPVALSEAHEQAVVSGADREQFWSLVEESLQEQKLPTYTSIKSRSKRTRWI